MGNANNDEITINHQTYRVDPHVVSKNSKFFESYFAEKWNHSDKGSFCPQPIVIEHPIFEIGHEEISRALTLMHKAAIFTVSANYHVYKIIFAYLMAPDMMADLDLYIRENLDLVRLQDLPSLYIYDPDLAGALNTTDVTDLVEMLYGNPDMATSANTGAVTDLLLKLELGHLTIQGLAVSMAKWGLSDRDVLNIYQFENYLYYQPAEASASANTRLAIQAMYASGAKILPSMTELDNRLYEFSLGLTRRITWENVALAGGSMLMCLNQNLNFDLYPYSDIDFFVYGDTAQQRFDAICRLVGEIRASFHEQCLVYQHQTRSILVIIVRNYRRNIHIIDSGKKTIHDAICDFDSQAVQIAFNGHEVLCVPCAVTDLLQQQVTFRDNSNVKLYRAIKFTKRGFSIRLDKDIQFVSSETYSAQEFSTQYETLAETDATCISCFNKYVFCASEPDSRVDFLVKKVFGLNYRRILDVEPMTDNTDWLMSYDSHVTIDTLNTAMVSQSISKLSGLSMFHLVDQKNNHIAIKLSGVSFGLNQRLSGDTIKIEIILQCENNSVRKLNQLAPKFETSKLVSKKLLKSSGEADGITNILQPSYTDNDQQNFVLLQFGFEKNDALKVQLFDAFRFRKFDMKSDMARQMMLTTKCQYQGKSIKTLYELAELLNQPIKRKVKAIAFVSFGIMNHMRQLNTLWKKQILQLNISEKVDKLVTY